MISPYCLSQWMLLKFRWGNPDIRFIQILTCFFINFIGCVGVRTRWTRWRAHWLMDARSTKDSFALRPAYRAVSPKQTIDRTINLHLLTMWKGWQDAKWLIPYQICVRQWNGSWLLVCCISTAFLLVRHSRSWGPAKKLRSLRSRLFEVKNAFIKIFFWLRTTSRGYICHAISMLGIFLCRHSSFCYHYPDKPDTRRNTSWTGNPPGFPEIPPEDQKPTRISENFRMDWLFLVLWGRWYINIPTKRRCNCQLLPMSLILSTCATRAGKLTWPWNSTMNA